MKEEQRQESGSFTVKGNSYCVGAPRVHYHLGLCEWGVSIIVGKSREVLYK